ncbi:MAG: portal protein [Alphaproteobacteria bacterium]|jgi:hypothetical protein|nr:portal protein [Alphaproteobacteria bacterium]
MEVLEFLKKYERAKSQREKWEDNWQDCYDYVMPQRGSFFNNVSAGAKTGEKLYDATAPDAVDNLGANLLANLTPPSSPWFSLVCGPALNADEKNSVSKVLERDSNIIQSNFDRPNFVVEVHQCYLDLIIAGTACLLFEEAPIGDLSAFKFTAVPLSQVVLSEGNDGKLNTTYREYKLTYNQLKKRFPKADLPKRMVKLAEEDPFIKFSCVEGVMPKGNAFLYKAVLKEYDLELKETIMDYSPFINFRWVKSPGETYGRSPVMKALPDIKTANKVVELVLKNASISATGIWQADDDGVLNPATVKLTPGTIIPKAVGSSGLTPLSMPGKFDVSQLVLNDLRDRIKHALWTDKLGAIGARNMTATEVLERSAEMNKVLGATFGRLRAELLTPLVLRAMSILKRRGEISDLRVDGRFVFLEYKSPLAQSQAQADIKNVLYWVQSASSLGQEGLSSINMTEVAKWLGKKLGVPDNLINSDIGVPEIPLEEAVAL